MIHEHFLTPEAAMQWASKVEHRHMRGNPCLRWMAAHNPHGQPILSGVAGYSINAYRMAAIVARIPDWELLVEDPTMHVHHNCFHTWCVNASHLEVLTREDHHLRHYPVPELPEEVRVVRVPAHV